MRSWDYNGIRGYISSLFGEEDRVVELDTDQCERIAQEFNSQYRGYKSIEHLIGNVGGTIREALIGTPYKVRCDYKNNKVIITRYNGTYPTVNHTDPVEHVRVLPVRATDYLPKNVPKYIKQGNEIDIIDLHMNMDRPVPLLLVGPKGTGKTLSVAHYAYMNDIPLIQFDCSENTKRQDLIGRFLLIGDEVVYELGVLPTAIEVANQYGKAILVLEELNALTPNTQKILNQVLDWRQHVYIPELGKTYYCNNDGKSKLLIVGTMNPSYYSGVFELNEDLRSRFVEYHFNYPYKNKEMQIIKKTTNLDDEEVKNIVTLADDLRNGYDRGEVSYAPSTRDLVLFANVFMKYLEKFDRNTALELALTNTILNRYDDELEKDTVKSRVMSAFGVQL